MGEVATINRNTDLIPVLQRSLYPGASTDSVQMVLDYCRAAGLDPMQKPVHIVPMWDSKARVTREVVMPGIGLYRIQAARTGEFGGISEPDFGPDEAADIGGFHIVFPVWCRVTVKRVLPNGHIAEFTAREFWRENYAVKGGQEKSIAPNAMWARRPYAQLAKCAEAQALRKAFPELGAAPTAEEMEGKALDAGQLEEIIDAADAVARIKAAASLDDLRGIFEVEWKSHPVSARKALTKAKDERKSALLLKAELDAQAEAEDATA